MTDGASGLSGPTDFMSNYITKPIPATKPPVGLVERPWGSFKQYANNCDCTVSLMLVLPGQRLSLQSHTGRAELWIVLDDGALVQVGEVQREHRAGDEIWIPANEKHRLSCGGDKPVRVLEVAFGNWQQDDIKRYEDDYRRLALGTLSHSPVLQQGALRDSIAHRRIP